MLIQIPFSNAWINPALITHIERDGVDSQGDDVASGWVNIHFTGGDYLHIDFDTEDEAMVATNELAAHINLFNVGLRHHPKENRDTTGRES